MLNETGEPIAFNAVRHLPHAIADNIMMGHRLVVLPDWQGLGLGWRFDQWMGEFLHSHGWRYHNVTSHPGLIASFAASPRWRAQQQLRKLGKGKSAHKAMGRAALQTRRLGTRSFVYSAAGAADERYPWLRLESNVAAPVWSKRRQAARPTI